MLTQKYKHTSIVNRPKWSRKENINGRCATLKYSPNHYRLSPCRHSLPVPINQMDVKSRQRKKRLLRGLIHGSDEWRTNTFRETIREKTQREKPVCVCVFVWFVNAPPVALLLSLITFVAAVHAHLASIWTHVALHALHSRLAGTQARHLLAVVPDRACGVAVTRCHGDVEGEKKEKKDWWENNCQLGTRGIWIAWFIKCTMCV